MKVTGEAFSFMWKKKRSRRGKIPKVFILSGKWTVTGQNSGELYAKKHRWGNSWSLGITLHWACERWKEVRRGQKLLVKVLLVI